MKKFISMFLAVVLILSFGTCAFAADVDPGTTVITNDGEIGTNNGTVVTNNGTVDTNNGTVTTNAATGTVNTNDTTGTVAENNGTVNTNKGKIGNNDGEILTGGNNGTVKDNQGTIYINNETVTTNNSNITWNGGTVSTNNGTIDSSDRSGTVVNNNQNGTVKSNYGNILTNAGEVERNEAGSTILINSGTVELNDTTATIVANKKTVSDNYGNITINTGNVEKNTYGIIDTNRGTVGDNIGTVISNEYSGTVTMEFGGNANVETNYGTVKNGKIVENQDGSESIKYGSDTIYGIGYTSELGEAITYGKNAVEGSQYSVLTEDEATAAKITKAGYKLEGWKDGDTSEEYTLGQKITINAPKFLSAIWSKLFDGGSQNVYDRFSGDENGKTEGKTFFFKQPVDKFQNVSFNGAHLEKDVDYIVTEVDGGTQIEFTEKFFEKNQYGTLSVAPIFDGAIYMLIAVNEQ